jgi:hypothetical protein
MYRKSQKITMSSPKLPSSYNARASPILSPARPTLPLKPRVLANRIVGGTTVPDQVAFGWPG